MGSPDVEAPKPTKEERQLQQEQAELLRHQRDILQSQANLQEMLLPVFAAQSGIQLEFDDEGNITGATSAIDPERQIRLQEQQFDLQQQGAEAQAAFLEELQADLRRQQEQAAEEEPLRAQQLEIERQLAERSLQALRGELPVDPALERSLEQQRSDLVETLRDRLGPGFETSTAGIQALQEFEESATSLRSAAQTGQLTLAEQLGQARTGLRMGQQQQELGTGLAGTSTLAQLGLGQQQQAIAQPQQALFGLGQSIAGGLGQTAGGFGAAQVPFQQQRGMEFQADIFNAQNSGGLGAGLGSLFGGIAGAIPWSDKRLKRWWTPIGTLYNGTALYLFEYVWGEQRIGVLAQDVPWATVEQSGYLAVDYGRL